MKMPKPWKRKSNGVWYVEINGKQVPLSTDKKEAFKEYNRIIRERGWTESTDDCKLHDLIDEHWNWYRKNNAPTTVAGRRYLSQGLRDFCPAGMMASEVRPRHIHKFIDSTGAESPSTINTQIAFFKHLFSWGRKHGYLSADPIADMEKPTPRIREEFIPPGKFREIMTAPNIPEFQDFIHFMLDTGIRPQEVTRLTAEMYRPDDNRFEFLIENSKGKKRKRVIYLTPASKKIADKLTEKWPKGPIFRNSRGTPYNKDNIGGSFRRLRKRLGMKKLCATMLRHSFAHYRLTSGQDAVTVAKLMGHVDTRMLMQRYGHLEQGTFLAEQAAAVRLPHVKAKKQ